MTIVVDIGPGGEVHFIDLSDAYPLVEHPDGKSGKVNALTMLSHHASHPADREAGGWHVVNRLPGESAPITRWQRLLNAVAEKGTAEHKKALGLLPKLVV